MRFAIFAMTTTMLLVAPARADERAEQQAKLKVLYDHGMKSYNLQDYKSALESFKAAYIERPDPSFLFNIGQCQRQLGGYREAQGSYRAYLRESVNLPEPAREQVKRLISEMDVALDIQKNVQGRPPQEVSPPVVAPEVHAAVTSLPHRRPYGSAAVALLSIGVVGVGVGAGLFGYASSLHPSAGATLGDVQSLSDAQQAYRISGGVAFGVGGAALATGTALLVLYFKDRKEHR